MTTTEMPPPAPRRQVPLRERPLRWVRDFGRPPRIMGLDVARALAILGMVGAHIGATESFEWLQPSTWTDLVHGRSSILFAVLAGISIALMTGRTERPAPERIPTIRLQLVGRGAAIFLIGIALEFLNTPIAVILTVYGLLYVAMIPFLRWRVWQLLTAAAVLAVVAPPLLSLLYTLLLGPGGPGVGLVVFGTYPITAWLAFALAGLAIGRMRIDRVRTVCALLVAGVFVSAAGYGLGALGAPGGDEGSWSSSYVEAEDGGSFGSSIVESSSFPAESSSFPGEGDSTSTWGYYGDSLAGMDPLGSALRAVVGVDAHSGGTAEILGSGGFAVVVIMLCLLLSRPLRWPLLPFAALGSMPLTAYSGHVLAVFIVAGPGGFFSDNAAWALTAVVLLVGATLWAAFVGRGPLERLVGRAAHAMASVPRR